LLFYVAFGAELPNPFTGKPAKCPGRSCMNELQRWVVVVYVIDVVGGRMWTFLRGCRRWSHSGTTGSPAERQAYLAQPQRTDDQWMQVILKVRMHPLDCHHFHLSIV
jgi:hypothetical protein